MLLPLECGVIQFDFDLLHILGALSADGLQDGARYGEIVGETIGEENPTMR